MNPNDEFANRITRAALKTLRHIRLSGLDAGELDGRIVLTVDDGRLVSVQLPGEPARDVATPISEDEAAALPEAVVETLLEVDPNEWGKTAAVYDDALRGLSPDEFERLYTNQFVEPEDDEPEDGDPRTKARSKRRKALDSGEES